MYWSCQFQTLISVIKLLFFSDLSICRCDADPSALAKYVLALVKKDKSEKELKALCVDQLDVFLQKGMGFVITIKIE